MDFMVCRYEIPRPELLLPTLEQWGVGLELQSYGFGVGSPEEWEAKFQHHLELREHF